MRVCSDLPQYLTEVLSVTRRGLSFLCGSGMMPRVWYMLAEGRNKYLKSLAFSSREMVV